MVLRLGVSTLLLAGALSIAFSSSSQMGAGPDHLLLLRADGSVWGLGSNTYGQLGSHDGKVRALPIPIDAGPWTKVAAGNQYSLGIRADGTLWAFGRNDAAQLGKGSRKTFLRPKRVGAHRWLDVAGGEKATLAIREDGSLRIWGGWLKGYAKSGLCGFYGQSRLVAEGQWQSVAMGGDHALALRRDGTLWALGANAAGQTGCGDTVTHASLCQVSEAHWTAIAAGEGFSMGIRADGALWTWGSNAYGEAGRGATEAVAGMGQVGTETWLSIAAGGRHVLALRADSSLWAWGAGGDGALGLGNLENQSRPVRIGADKWLTITAGRNFSAGLRGDGNGLIWGNLGFSAEQTISDRTAKVSHPTLIDRRLILSPLTPATFGDGNRTLVVEAFRGDSVMMTSGNKEVATLAGNEMRIVGAGMSRIGARAMLKPEFSQGNSADTLAAAQDFEVAKATQHLDFPELKTMVAGSAGCKGIARSDAGLPVYFQSSDARILRVGGNRLEAVAPGRITVSVNQPGDANHLPAASVSHAVTVLPAPEPSMPGLEEKSWVRSHSILVMTGGGALIAGGAVWTYLALAGDHASKAVDLGRPPADPVVQGAR